MNSDSHESISDAPGDGLAVTSAEEKPQLRAKTGFSLGTYVIQARDVLCHPKQFFNNMPGNNGYAEPLGFLTLTAAIYALLQAIGHLNVLLFFSAFFGSLIKVGIGCFIVNFALRHLGGKGNAEGTFRVLAYSKATLLLAWIVLGKFAIGGWLSLGYTLYLNVLGCEKVHELNRTKVAAVVITLGLIGFFIQR